MMPTDYHRHDPSEVPADAPVLDPTDTAVDDRPRRPRSTTALSVVLTVVTVLIAVAVVLGVLMWLVS